MIFDQSFRILGKFNQEFPQHFPKPSWVEHDLGEIWDSVCQAVRGALEVGGIGPGDIAAIGITNQRETTCLWDRATGEQATRAIVWQDRRTAKQCAALKKRGLESVIRRKTGLLLDPYFSGTKIQWMLKNQAGLRKKAMQGKLAFGTVDSYLVYRMSGRHVTDVTNASRTLLMNIKTMKWDSDLVKLFGVPKAILPEILPSAVEYGTTHKFLNLPDGIPITGIAGDQQAALFGQACFKVGAAKCTYGTGAFILANTGPKPVMSKHRLLTTVAWQLGNKPTYCLEGSAFVAGAAVQWLRDGLKIIKTAPEVETLARTVTDNGGVTFVPALAGLGAPHWIPTATGMFTGLTRGTNQGHIARATLEGVAFRVRELLEAIGKDMGKSPRPLKVDGGMTDNGLLMQIQADLLGTPVIRSGIAETTALGAGMLAGLAVGYWNSQSDIEKSWKSAEGYKSSITPAARKRWVAGWEKAVSGAKTMA